MTAQTFRKKPVVIEAMQFTGYNAGEVAEWISGNGEVTIESDENGSWEKLTIHTLEGDMVATREDWVIKGIKGEFYPCKPDIFLDTYERAAPEAEIGTEDLRFGSES